MPGGDAERRLADVERVEQRPSRPRRRNTRRARRATRRRRRRRQRFAATGARDAERGPRRIEREQEHGDPQPTRRALVAGNGRARLDDRDGSQQAGQCVLLIVHAGLAVAVPGARDPVRPGGVRGIVRAGLLGHGQSRDAGGPFGERIAQVGQPWIRLRGEPPPGERLADHAVPAAAREVAAPHQAAPGPVTLAQPPGLHAEQLGLPTRVGHLVLAERRAAALGERHRLGQAVSGPVVRDRRPVVLDFVARRGQVGADAIRRLAPPLAGESSVQKRQRPVGLAGVVLGVPAGDRRSARSVVLGQDRARRLGLSDQKTPE